MHQERGEPTPGQKPKSIEKLEKTKEIKEKEKVEHPITVYYLRHGESLIDKTDPLRGLTEKGIREVIEAIKGISEEIKDKTIQIRLYSSGSERTKQQCVVAAYVLKEAGFSNLNIGRNSLPQKETKISKEGISFSSALEGEKLVKEQEALAKQLDLKIEGPGIQKRITELKASPEYKKKIRTLEKKTGISAVIHWLMDKDLPADAESPEEKAKVIQDAVDITQKWSEHMKERELKPLVALVFGHSSGLTAYGTKIFEIEPEKLGEVENAEGIKINFSGEEGDRPEVIPFGKVIKEKVEKAKEK